MQCPDCGYFMSDLDKECLRCKNEARQSRGRIVLRDERPVDYSFRPQTPVSATGNQSLLILLSVVCVGLVGAVVFLFMRMNNSQATPAPKATSTTVVATKPAAPKAPSMLAPIYYQNPLVNHNSPPLTASKLPVRAAPAAPQVSQPATQPAAPAITKQEVQGIIEPYIRAYPDCIASIAVSHGTITSVEVVDVMHNDSAVYPYTAFVEVGCSYPLGTFEMGPNTSVERPTFQINPVTREIGSQGEF